MVFNRRGEGRAAEAAQQPPQAAAARTTPPPPPPAPPRQAPAVTIPSESVIGSDLSIEGQSITIRCRGALRVNGHLHGDVHSLQVVIGEQASINGAVAAETVNVFGRVNGAILGTRVVLHPTAMVEGDIHSQTLSIEQGASFDGRSRKVTDPAEIAPQLEPAPGYGAPQSSAQQIHGSNTGAAPGHAAPPRFHGG